MQSSLHALDFKSLSILDGGKINTALQMHLQRASLDCQDRPGDPKARTVTVDLTFVPVTEQDGDCTEVKMDVKIKSKVPVHQSKAYSAGLRRNGTFVFNEYSLDSVGQGTFLEDDDE